MVVNPICIEEEMILSQLHNTFLENKQGQDDKVFFFGGNSECKKLLPVLLSWLYVMQGVKMLYLECNCIESLDGLQYMKELRNLFALQFPPNGIQPP